MKIFFTLFLVCGISTQVQAGLDMKPGKWKIETMMSKDGKAKADPMIAMNEAMSKMPEAERKMVQDAMDKAMSEQSKNRKMPKVNIGKEGMTLCYTKDLLEGDLGLKEQYEEQNCKVSDLKQSSSAISLKFKCKDGSSGDVKINLTDSTHYTGRVDLVSGDRQKSEIEMKGTFLSAECN